MNYERQYYEADQFWSGSALSDTANLTRFEKTKELIPSSVRTVVDAGCGNGVFGNFLRDKRPEMAIFSFDRSASAIRHASTVRFQADVTAIPLATSAVDCVTCLEVLEHLPQDAYSETLAELTRVARRYVVIGVPFEEEIEKNVTRCPACRTVFNVDLHVRRFDARGFETLLDGHGFRYVRGVNPVPEREFLGQQRVQRIREAIAAARHGEVFRSPTCPLCGYTVSHEVQQAYHARKAGAVESTIKSGIRAFAHLGKRFWPQRETPGYWIVGLFERQN